MLECLNKQFWCLYKKWAYLLHCIASLITLNICAVGDLVYAPLSF